MNKTHLSLGALAVLMLAGAAQAYPVKMTGVYQRASSGSLSTLKWDGCTTYTATTGCINPANANLAAAGIVPSTAVWDWNPTTGVLSMTGSFNVGSTISSSGSAAASMVIGDKVTNLSINTITHTVSASSYACGEGNFLANVGANGCLDLDLGADGVLNSTVAYNVGGDATCVQLTLGGDDDNLSGAKLPRGLTTLPARAGCDATSAAFDMFTVFEDNTATGGRLQIGIDIPITDANASWLEFVRAPDAVDDSADALPGVATPINVLANDQALTDPVTVAIGTAPGKGTATITGANPGPKADIRISYTSDAGETGTDTFTYTVTDATGTTTSPATVTVTILDVGANPDTATTTRNQPININVAANDTGFTGPVTITITAAPDAGGAAVAGAAAGTVDYTPSSAPGSAGYTEHFTYQITDGTLTDTAEVTVTVNNTVPVANPGAINSISTVGADPSSRTGTYNAAGGGNSLGNTPATVTVSVAAGRGTTSVSGSTVTYTPNGNFYSGTDTFGYTITDLDGETANNTVTVTIANANPALADAAITATSGQASPARALSITAGNGPLSGHTLAVTTQGTNGSCALTGTSVRYTSNAGYAGADSCVITVTDLDGSTATGTISVTVNAAASTGGGGGGEVLPGGGGALDGWLLSLLGAGIWLRRRRSQG